MQVGLSSRRLTLREIFSLRMAFLESQCPIRALGLGLVGQFGCPGNT